VLLAPCTAGGKGQRGAHASGANQPASSLGQTKLTRAAGEVPRVRNHSFAICPYKTLEAAVAPVLDVDVLASDPIIIVVITIRAKQRHSLAIELMGRFNARQFEQSRNNISMRRGPTKDLTPPNPRPTNKERNMDVLLDVTRFPRRKPVLANMEAVVRGVDDVSVLHLVRVGFQPLEDVFDQVVDCLQGEDSLAVFVVCACDGGFVHPFQRLYPAAAGSLVE